MMKSNSGVQSIVFKNFWSGLGSSLLLCIAFTYAFSALIYFTILIATSASEDSFYVEGVALQNISYALCSLIFTYLYIKFLDHKIRSNWAKYISVALINFLVQFIFSYFFYFWYWSKMPDYDSGGNNMVISYIYSIIPSLVGMIFFYIYQSSKRIEERFSKQQVQLLQLEQTKTKAELQALQARINPHFLYNALNSIASLVHENPDTAEDMTLKLSTLFRKTTGRKHETFWSLQEELDIVSTYLEVEKIRFGDRLQFKTNAKDDLTSIQVPTFCIQPLVENAIKHGISKITGQGVIEINCQVEIDRLFIGIHDNGPKFDLGDVNGYGLTSIQNKLKILYKDQGELLLTNVPRKEVHVKIPVKNHE